MALYDLGVTADEAQKDGNFEPLPMGQEYEFRVKSWENKPSQAGRDMHNFQLEIVNHPDFAGRIIFYRCPMPFVDPVTGERKTSGIGFLQRLCEAVGMPWDGTSYDPDLLINRVGTIAEVKHRPRMQKQTNATGQEVMVPTGDVDTEVKKFK